MKIIEEVLDGLEYCAKHGDCEECPYYENKTDSLCYDNVRLDAASLIRTLSEKLDFAASENRSMRDVFDLYGGEEGIVTALEERDRLADENRAMKAELKVNLGNQYWMNICRMNARQEAKGMDKYGEPLEQNTTLTTTQRIEHLQEEMIDALKYCEHLKQVAEDGITANDYQRACLRTATGDRSEWLENAIYGIIGEAGEIVDLVKKHKWQGHELDREALILECGDLAWYQALLASALDTSLGEVYEKNIEKLKQRYPAGFSKERSVNRDKD